MALAPEQVVLFPFENEDLLVEAREVLGEDADRWLDGPLVRGSLILGMPDDPAARGETRRSIVEGNNEAAKHLLREELRRVRFGIPE